MLQKNSHIFIKHFNYSVSCAIISLICVLIFGCESKQNAVYELLELRTEVKEHGHEYSQTDWENAIDRYVDICQKLDEMQFTTEERMEIDKVKGEIAGYAATIAIQEVSDKVQTIAGEIESFTEGFSSTFNTP